MSAIGPTATAALQQIETLIGEGVYPPLSRLPSERSLAEMTGISRSTLRDALHELAERGIIEPSPWRGWFVAGNTVTERAELASFTTLALRGGYRPGAVVLSLDVRPATDEESAALNIASDQTVTELRRLRTLDGDAACLDRSVVSTDVFPGFEHVDMRDRSLYEVMESVYGRTVVRSDYAIRADYARSDEAEQLGVDERSAVLIGDEVATDAAGSPLIMGHVVYRHDAYSFRATLFRPVDGNGVGSSS